MKYFLTKAGKGVAVIGLGLALVLPMTIAAPRSAHAAAPVVDAFNLVHNIFSAITLGDDWMKEFVLDALAWNMKETIRQSLVRSTVNWINSGFEGSPAYVTDIENNLLQVSDAVANRFFAELSAGSINSPFGDSIEQTVRNAYFLQTGGGFYLRNPYTLDRVSSDPQAFLNGDFSKGGFAALREVALNPQNNPYGALTTASNELNQEILAAQNQRLTELGFGNGVLSWRGNCDKQPSGDSVALTQSEPCFDSPIKTPGATIKAQLDQHLGSTLSTVVTADELNEVIGALFQQLTSKVLGEGGLSGVSQPTGGGGRSYVDQATDPSTIGSGSIGGNFLTTFDYQIQRVEEYQSDWQRLRDAASNALARCPDSTLARTTLDESAVALNKAQTTLASLRELRAKAAALTANNNNGFTDIWSEFERLQASPTYPSASEFADAKIDGLDTGSAEPSSLYTTLTRMSSSVGRLFCQAN